MGERHVIFKPSKQTAFKRKRDSLIAMNMTIFATVNRVLSAMILFPLVVAMDSIAISKIRVNLQTEHKVIYKYIQTAFDLNSN